MPRTSAAQSKVGTPVSRDELKAGDLVFFHHRGRVYHVAIYAGHGKVWHSPHSGSRVKLERIWTSSFYVGRVRA